MRFLIAGTGSIGQRHIHNLQAMRPDISFVLLRADGRVDTLSRKLDAPVVRSFDEALAYAPDVMLVATPSELHAELLLPAIAAGLPMYVEKPVVTKREQILAVYDAITEHKYRATTLVGCNLRFLPSLRRMRSLVQEGAIGRVVRGCFDAGQWLPDWRPDQDYLQSYSAFPERGGGVVLDLVHEFDAARWLCSEMEEVQALTARVPTLDIAAEAVAGVVMRSQTGAVVTFGLDYVARRPLRRYQLVGEMGTLTWELPTGALCMDNQAGCQIIDCGEAAFDVAKTYITAMSEFLLALEQSSSTSQPLIDGLRSSELAIRVREQAWSSH